jgi:hypothetical protein
MKKHFLPCLLLLTELVHAGPLKVFILAGQSNMEGHAKIETFDYIGDDPATAPLLKKMRNADGTRHVCDHAYISYLTGIGENNGAGFGKLTAGYGSRRNPAEDGGKIGPEFTFGITMDEAFEEPVLIIKTAWGGKSLYYDYRPPSAGVYPRTSQDIEKNRNPENGSGHYYRLMTAHVKSVLADIKRVCPEYEAKQGYEIAGFVWFQGFNDMVNRDVYPPLPKGSTGNRFAKYSELMAGFIRDVRTDLNAPKMPFVIGVMGVDGAKANEDNLKFREAMAEPASLPEFQGNVVAVPTAPFWDEPIAAVQEKYEQVKQMAYLLKTKDKNHANKDGTMTNADQKAFLKKFEADLITPAEAALRARGASNAGYHYLGCAKTFAMMGKAFADAILTMGKSRPTTSIQLTSPLDYQVIQRNRQDGATIAIAGTSAASAIEARLGTTGPWQSLKATFDHAQFQGTLKAPAGGWYRLEVRALKDGGVVGETSVAHVGIGEVFVVAGQSNAANHGQEKQSTRTGRVASFDGQRWQLANDPQPGASGRGGSFMPPLGDALVQKFNVPVGFIPCGIGATSVREWLPKGATFPNPPTIESRVQKRPDGTWESKGAAYDAFVARMKSLGPHGFRAVLWHQGESDANQKDPTRTLPGKLYREHLDRVIRDSRRDIGWEAPWFVAQVSYHVPGDEASPDIRAAQASLWKDGIALEGPDSDALKGELRERNGQGVHFSGPGLREHAARWAEKLVPWIETK